MLRLRLFEASLQQPSFTSHFRGVMGFATISPTQPNRLSSLAPGIRGSQMKWSSLPGTCRWPGGRFFYRAGAVGMDLDARAVQRNRFELEAHELVALQLLEDLVEDPGLRPPNSSGCRRCAIPKPSRQPTPLAAVFGDIQNGIEHLQIREADVPRWTGR